MLAIALGAVTPAPAFAHAFGQTYKLPLPYWLYIYGAVAALALSFILICGLVPTTHGRVSSRDIADTLAMRGLRKTKPVWRGLAVFALGLSIASGLFGTTDPARNFNMTAFWIVFALGAVYVCTLFGNVYAAVSPWQTLAEWLARVWPASMRGRVAYPQRFGNWPAVALYMAFIWVELLGNTRPLSLAWILVTYTTLTLFGCWLFGAKDWLRHGEFFAVLMRFVARVSPLHYQPDIDGPARWQLRPPLSGLFTDPPKRLSSVVFILFLLSSTAFDGLSETVVWFNIFWRDVTGLIEPLIGEHPIYAYVQLRPWYIAYETVWLIASPFLYLGVVALFVWLGKIVARSDMPLRALILRFSLSLLPIALVYHITHYYTLILTQGIKIRALVSDPFGVGWDVFGTAMTLRLPYIPDMGTVWYSQVALILIGHVISVYIAHVEALRLFGSRRKALVSQIPMLALMMLMTTVGLWILAQPLQGS